MLSEATLTPLIEASCKQPKLDVILVYGLGSNAGDEANSQERIYVE